MNREELELRIKDISEALVITPKWKNAKVAVLAAFDTLMAEVERLKEAASCQSDQAHEWMTKYHEAQSWLDKICEPFTRTDARQYANNVISPTYWIAYKVIHTIANYLDSKAESQKEKPEYISSVLGSMQQYENGVPISHLAPDKVTVHKGGVKDCPICNPPKLVKCEVADKCEAGGSGGCGHAVVHVETDECKSSRCTHDNQYAVCLSVGSSPKPPMKAKCEHKNLSYYGIGQINPHLRWCDDCKKWVDNPDFPQSTKCPECGGSGQIKVFYEEVDGFIYEACSTCKGKSPYKVLTKEDKIGALRKQADEESIRIIAERMKKES